MKKWMMIVLGISIFSANAETVLEEWTFDAEPNGTSFSNLVNSAGMANFGEDHPNATVQAGALRISGASESDIYRNAELTDPGLENGIYELSWDWNNISYSEKNANAALFLRGENNQDLFQVRLQVVDEELTLQVRTKKDDGSNNIINADSFGGTSLASLGMRVVVDLNNSRMDLFYSVDGAEEKQFSSGINYHPVGYIRLSATPSKFTAVEGIEYDNIRFAFIGQGAVEAVTFIEYLMDEDIGSAVGQLANTGTDAAKFGNSASIDGVTTDGAGNLVFEALPKSGNAAQNLGTVLTNGVVELEYRISEWDLASVSETGNNFGFELRDSAAGKSMKITVDQKSGGTRINFVGGASAAPRETLSGISSGTNLTVKVQVDLDRGLFHAFYNTGNGWVLKATEQELGIDRFDQFRVVANGSTAWEADAYGMVDYARVSIPAPKKLVDYQFSDAIGSDLKELWNNGTVVSNWTQNAVGEVFADGEGNLKLENATTSRSRYVELGEFAQTNDTTVLEWRLSSWDVGGLAGSDGFTFALIDAESGAVVKSVFNLTGDGSDTRIQMADAAGDSKQKAGFGLLESGEGIRFRLEANLDDEVFRGYYRMDSDAEWTEVTDENTAGLSRIDEIKLTVSGWQAGVNAFALVDYLTLVSVETEAEVTPESLYYDWVASYPEMGDLVGMEDDADGDGVSNLAEYAFGGDPTDPTDTGFGVSASTRVDDGTSYLYYTFTVRTDATARGLVYGVEETTNLKHVAWKAVDLADYEVVGLVNAGGGWSAMTIRVSADGPIRFVRSNVSFAP